MDLPHMRMLFSHLCLGSNGFSLKEDLAADQASAGYPNFKHWYICIQAGECEDAFDCNEWNPCCSLAGYCGTEASGHCSGAVTIDYAGQLDVTSGCTGVSRCVGVSNCNCFRPKIWKKNSSDFLYLVSRGRPIAVDFWKWSARHDCSFSVSHQ